MTEKIDEEEITEHYVNEMRRDHELTELEIAQAERTRELMLKTIAEVETAQLRELFEAYIKSVIDRDCMAPEMEERLILLFGKAS